MQPTRLLTKQAASLVRAVPVGGTPSAGATRDLGRVRDASVKGMGQKPSIRYHAGRPLLRRIGKCLAFGCNPQQTADAAALVRTIVNRWSGIQMTLEGRGTHEDLVYKGPLWEGGDKSLEASQPPWQGLGRHTQLARVAQQAAVRFLDYSRATAAPEDRDQWQILRNEKIQNDPHYTPRLMATGVQFSHVLSRMEQPQLVSACARLNYSSKSFLEQGYFTLKVFVWSHLHMTRLAEVTLWVRYNRNADPAMAQFLDRELRRLLTLGRDPAVYDRVRQEHDAVLSAIDKLEKETWDRHDAVEDFGTASSD
ncbi:uncharacterized protein ColSpa_06286 [Colletotrichum spaethianum]|uniref:Uncharacterized protein n=1 Tax=Colletotrichum spaethianum TaxID=700344 RepID=A0AA37LHK2_9PEZI|nr:uncharacterized protein ColSpa_06286 [Colletotrichum spaethianum]GKT46105.1 hypothetical protein ColSpa_06286 [Colletotrichum spaethianum]